jgi:hypothetical protein
VIPLPAQQSGRRDTLTAAVFRTSSLTAMEYKLTLEDIRTRGIGPLERLAEWEFMSIAMVIRIVALGRMDYGTELELRFLRWGIEM